MIKLRTTNILLALGLLCMALGQLQQQVDAAGCPFDDSGCKRDCRAQGCQIGYCGNFAWSQCICRKCGSGWNLYDKVTYNSDKTVNQTELDSLELKGQAPPMLSNSGDRPVGGQQRDDPSTTTTSSTTTAVRQSQQPKQQAATLTTLLIPDLSDTSKLDLNDIPDDENSEKFLDYLTRNHEKLVQAQHSQRQQQQHQQLPANENEACEDEEDSDQQSTTPTTTSTTTTTTTTTTSMGGVIEPADEGETVEIQISTSNNNQQQQQQQPPVASWGGQRAHEQSGGGQMARLLRMRVADEQQVADDLELES